MEVASTGATCCCGLMPYKPRHMLAKMIRPTKVVSVVGSRASAAFGIATVSVPPVLEEGLEFGVVDDEHAPSKSDVAATTAMDAIRFLEVIFGRLRAMGADIPASFYFAGQAPCDPPNGTPALPESQRPGSAAVAELAHPDHGTNGHRPGKGGKAHAGTLPEPEMFDTVTSVPDGVTLVSKTPTLANSELVFVASRLTFSSVSPSGFAALKPSSTDWAPDSELTALRP